MFEHITYPRAVFDETLRLYPPAWGQPRETVEEDEIAESVFNIYPELSYS